MLSRSVPGRLDSRKHSASVQFSTRVDYYATISGTCILRSFYCYWSGRVALSLGITLKLCRSIPQIAMTVHPDFGTCGGRHQPLPMTFFFSFGPVVGPGSGQRACVGKKIGVLTRMGYLFSDTVIRRPITFNRQCQCYFLSVVPGTCRKQRLFGGSGDQGCVHSWWDQSQEATRRPFWLSLA